jgi:hypothetical protein
VQQLQMLRTSTIIVITKIMVEVLKMNLLLRAAARMATATDEGCRAEHMPSRHTIYVVVSETTSYSIIRQDT